MTDQQQAPPAAPANAVEAQARLTTLTSDKGWGEKLMAGDMDTRQEFNQLTELAGQEDVVETVMSGILPDIPSSSQREMAGVTSMLRERGIGDQVIRETLTNRPVTPQERIAVESWKAQRMRDQGFVKRFLDGDSEAVTQMTLADIALSAPVRGDNQ